MAGDASECIKGFGPTRRLYGGGIGLNSTLRGVSCSKGRGTGPANSEPGIPVTDSGSVRNVGKGISMQDDESIMNSIC